MEPPLDKHPFLPSNDINILIARSGYFGRHILRLYRFIREGKSEEWLHHRRLYYLLSSIGISRLADFLYTYYIGGSLTRQDQHTFAKLHGIEDRAYLLSFFNALAFGIPAALLYFLLGEGFDLLSDASSYAELSAAFLRHISLLIGSISLFVDLFRAFDAILNKRCWAPFGIFPFIINLPTYFNRFAERTRANGFKNLKKNHENSIN